MTESIKLTRDEFADVLEADITEHAENYGAPVDIFKMMIAGTLSSIMRQFERGGTTFCGVRYERKQSAVDALNSMPKWP